MATLFDLIVMKGSKLLEGPCDGEGDETNMEGRKLKLNIGPSVFVEEAGERVGSFDR